MAADAQKFRIRRYYISSHGIWESVKNSAVQTDLYAMQNREFI